MNPRHDNPGHVPPNPGATAFVSSTAPGNGGGEAYHHLPPHDIGWAEAKAIAARHFDHLGANYRVEGYRWPACIRGAIIPLTEYESTEDLRLLKPEEPGMTLHDQQLINRAFARLVKKHGAFPRRHLLRAVDYFKWLAATGHKNTATNRAQFSAEHAPMLASFDPHDRARIERALASQQTGEIALAIEKALAGFTERIVAQIQQRLQSGAAVKTWAITRPATAFDDIVQKLALQILAEKFDGITIAWLPNETGSPDVIFRADEADPQ